jgi:diguanylate cyclase (GGDEF)-like protein
MQLVFEYRVDLLLFLSGAMLCALLVDRFVRPHVRIGTRCGLWFAVAGLAGAGLGAAHIAQERQRADLQASLGGLAPTYAAELEQRGHYRVGLDTPADDPLYLRLVEKQKRWLEINRSVNDIYTMRLLPDGRIALIVDSETDYDHDGHFQGEREARTAIGEIYPEATSIMQEAFAGNVVFDDVPYTDRWGTWVSAYAPLRDPQGSSDGIVGVDLDARQWIAALLWARCSSLAFAAVLIVTLVGATAITSIVQADSRERKLAAEQLRLQAEGLRAANESLAQARDEAQAAARLDKLTGLPNRALLLDRLQAQLDRARSDPEQSFALMFLDFDRFKIINDSLGHKAGDALLRAIAERLRWHVRADDSIVRLTEGNTAARLGGDEFVVLLSETKGVPEATSVAQRLLAILAQPYQVEEHEVHSTASIGIVISSSEYAAAEDMLRDADTAMYEAKRIGKARFVVFDASMRLQVQRRLQLETDLRKAIQAGQLFLEYQPIVSLSTGAITSAEALLRWQHPVLGPISPAEFVPIAEDTGLIMPIGEWVLRAGCRQMAAWQQSLGSAAPATLSINLSRRQFSLTNLDELIHEVLASEGLEPTALQLEVTESLCMHDAVNTRRVLQSIKKLGVRLAIDDFGTGLSSLASLHQFPADVLKIDRSFVARVDEAKDIASLVHAATMLARNLGMTTVAEGIEKPSQVLALQELGCQYAQGYFFGKPMGPTELERMLSGNLREKTETAGAIAFAHRWSDEITLGSGVLA